MSAVHRDVSFYPDTNKVKSISYHDRKINAKAKVSFNLRGNPEYLMLMFKPKELPYILKKEFVRTASGNWIRVES